MKKYLSNKNMLVKFIVWFFKKFIYTPHIHTLVADTTYEDFTSGFGAKITTTGVIYKCSSCGKVLRVK